ncbi:MAG: 3-oxoacyl-[acyl-carrier protein] reductase [Thermoleophilaceae bacterium]|nr:3-oxoacyl-[acyl-carrier protein] reductase [Thermoleophilaceae bacterium]
MADRVTQVIESPPGRFIAKQLGVPTPSPLRRYEPGQDVLDGAVLVGGAPGGRLLTPTAAFLRKVDAEVQTLGGAHLRKAVSRAPAWTPSDEEADQRFYALVFDASGIASSDELREAYEFFHPSIRRIATSGRVIVLATPPEMSDSPRQAIAQRALEGFIRSVGKEVGKGATAQLVYVAPGAEGNFDSTLRFLLSSKSAYVSGQVVRVGAGPSGKVKDEEHPQAGRVAVVTGASRGIGASIAETLARDGAHVVCLDVPAQGQELAEVANRIGGSSLQLDVTDDDAAATIVEHLRERHGGVDLFVHNAGVTRDKTLGRMDDQQWDLLMAINLTSQEAINEALLEGDTLRPDGRIVTVSSMSGIAGNRGQVNYATSKAGVIGIVDAYAPILAERRATINAVAPGFIETQMTAAMPVATREAGRRMNSLSQGGLPVDVAETIAWMGSPASGGVNGNTIRVCGQALLGA